LFCSLPQTCASTQSCLGALRPIPLTSWLDFCSDMHCRLWTLYRQVCAYPIHVQSIELNTGVGLNVEDTLQLNAFSCTTA
jgi:hypothetical protein